MGEVNETNFCEIEKRLDALENAHIIELKREPSETKTSYKCAFITIGLVYLLTISAGIIMLTTDLFPRRTQTQELWSTSNALTINGSLSIINRKEWMAEAEQTELEDLKWPVRRVIIAHTETESCQNKLQCDAVIRNQQETHTYSNDWNDIAYNFLVGGDGLVYEGRGWDKIEQHSLGYNRDSISIAFIGSFDAKLPTVNELEAAKHLIEIGVKLGAIAKDYKLYGARQMFKTDSPGQALYIKIMKWSHWSIYT